MSVNRRNLVANYLGSGWSALMGIAFVPLYVKYLGIEAYGLIGIFAMLQTYIALLDAGITPTLSRELALSQAGVRSAQATRDLVITAEMIYITAMIGLIFCLSAAAPLLSRHWIHAGNIPTITVTAALRIMVIGLALRWLTSLYRGAYIGLQHYIWLNSCSALFSTLRGLGAVAVLALLRPTITAFFEYQGLVAAAEAVVMAVNLRKVLPIAPGVARFSLTRMTEVWRFAAGMTALTIVSTTLTQFDKLLLSKLVSLSTFGYYVIASSVAGSLYLLVGPISNSSYPQFTGHVARGDQTGLTDAYHNFAQLTAIVVMPATLLMVVFSQRILLTWTGNTLIALAAAPLVSVLAFGNMLHGLMHTSYTLQLAYGKTRFNIVVNCIAVILLLPAMYFAVGRYGPVGAAAVWALLNLGYVLIATPLLHRTLLRGEMGYWYRNDVLAPLAGTMAAIGIVAASVPPATSGTLIQNVAVLATAFIAATLGASLSTSLGRRIILSGLDRIRFHWPRQGS